MFLALLLFDDYFPMHSSLKVPFIFSLLILLGCVTIEDASYDIDPKMAIAMKPEFSIFHHSDNESTIYFKLKTEDILYTRNDRSKPFNANLKLAYALYNETGKTLIDSGSILWKDFYTKQKKDYIDTNLFFQLPINNKAKLKLSLSDINRLRTYEKLVDVNKKDIFNREFYLLKDTSGNILMNNMHTTRTLLGQYKDFDRELCQEHALQTLPMLNEDQRHVVDSIITSYEIIQRNIH